MIKFSIKAELDFLKNAKSAQHKAQIMLDTNVLRDSQYFVPEDSNFLRDSGILNTKFGNGQIIWDTPYAKRLYYNPRYNFSHDKNPNAKGLWFEEAMSLHKDEWIEKTRQEYLKYFKG